MSAFVATPPNSQSGTSADLVANDGWYPDQSIRTTREILAMTTAVPDARLRDAIVGAMLTINGQLATWRALREAEGATALALAGTLLVPAARLIAIYPRAIRAAVAAELVDLQHELSATDGGRARDDVQVSPADHHRRIAIHAVRDMQGKRRTKASLV